MNILTTEIHDSTTQSIREILWNLGWWNILLVGALALLVVQTYAHLVPRKTLTERARKLIENVLQFACASLTYQYKSFNIRAIITLINNDGKTRTTRFSYNVKPDPERTATFPLEFGVTGEAIINRKVVVRELPSDHMKTYPPEVRRLILPELKWVLAAPVYLPEKSEAGPVGVLAFDSTEWLSKIGFDSRRAMDVAQAWADLIGDILSWAEITKLYHHGRH